MLNIKVVATSLGIFAAVSFILCVLYGLIMPASLHSSALMEMVLPGFQWLTLTGFFLGLIESLLYGVFAGVVFVPIYNLFARRWGAMATR
jgi:hypothetical protein